MADQYRVPMENVKGAGVEPKEGNNITLQLGGSKVVNATITKVEKDFVVVTAKQ